jgi:LuxR family maltose regulon positive regulatory protein
MCPTPGKDATVADPLIETKLLLPRDRRDVVPRPRLASLLERAPGTPLTVVSAPAGFGKTTVLSVWINTWLSGTAASGEARSAAWVSLTERDRHSASFWTYVLHALDRAVPGSAASSLTLLRSGRAPIESVLAGVVNELSVHAGTVTLVLDDYHLADGPDVAEAMAFLVEHLPPQLRLILSTRADPALPLSRMRVRGELLEVRAAELRFTADEVAAYLNDLHGLGLPGADVTALEARTEGWAAALQLAALSLRDRADTSGFIAGFAGDDRYVVDYLADEVLSRQPDHVRRFLLDTAILDRLAAPLCDAVTPAGRAAAGAETGLGGRSDGRAMLDLLERQNLFLLPLDDHRHWYRYHHLFADVLHTHLLRERPEDVPDLHRRASRWYAENGQTEDAIRHALAAGDVEDAADLVERALPGLRRDRREGVIIRWIEQLPPEVVDRRPVLAVGFIGAQMASNHFDGVAERLRDLEEMLKSPEADLVVVDRSELDRVPGAIETYWAGLALVGGDPAGTIKRAAHALEVAAEGDNLTISAAAGLMGLAFWATGDVVAAHRSYLRCADGLTRAGHLSDVLGCSLALADMELTLGRLADAERALHRALALAERHATDQTSTGSAGKVVRGTADMLVALSRAAWHRNDLATAADYLRRADDLGEGAGLPQNPYRWRVAMARLRATERDWSTALDLLDEAQRVYVGDFSPPVHPVHATRARVLIASGDLAGAAAWAREHGVAPDDELSYVREYELLTLARLLLSQHRATEPGRGPHGRAADALLVKATRLLDRLRVAAQEGERVGTVIEVEALRARAQHAAGNRAGALAALRHAMSLSEPDRWVRFFVDAGPEIAELLHTLAAADPNSGYARELLSAAASGDTHPADTADTDTPTDTPCAPTAAMPADPLSERELAVLRFLGSELDGPAIARELVVSLNTVRTHTKHIYTKLGVNNRRAAVSKAHQLGLLSRSGVR